jgi:uncharacterized membrane protein YhaH (DUF805 family)
MYWPSYIAVLALNFALYFQLLKAIHNDAVTDTSLLLWFIGGLAILYVNLAISVKRLHDIGYGGFLAVAVLIPLLNLAFNIWVGILPSAPGPNRFGPMPDAPAS